MNILFLTPWYPNRNDAMDGLFVRKHAQAVRRFVDNVELICLKPNENNPIEASEETIEGVHEIVVYYPNPKNSILKIIQLYKAFRIGYALLNRKPNIVQVNVLTRCGIIAYLLFLLKGIPYIIVEHWTRYHDGSACFKNRVHKWLTQIVVRNAKRVLTVSNHLAKAMQSHGLSSNHYSKINNVVDDFFYSDYESKNNPKKRILHVSCFDDKAKNISGILRATRRLAECRDDFELVLVGTGKDYDMIRQEYESLHFPKNVVYFVGEQTPQEVCQWLQKSDFMVMFSNYENAPVVISEALAVGVPVIATNVGGISEMIDEKCGILQDPYNEQKLAEGVTLMMENCDIYNKEAIRTIGLQYSYKIIGGKLTSIYSDILSPQARKCNIDSSTRCSS